MSYTSFNPSLIAAAVFGIIAITGCSKGSDTDTGTITTPFSATATGVAAKGVIKFANVTAYELNPAGAVIGTVGTASTDATGRYALAIGSNYTGGPIKLELTGKSDGSTKMVCDVSAGCGAGVPFGQDYSWPAALTLSAYQQAAASGAAITAQITPYTNMAAARIQAMLLSGSSLDNNLVANAISEVSQVVGVNIAVTEPVDITNPIAVAVAGADALQYAAFNAGIGEVAFAGGNFETGMANVAAAFSDGQFNAGDTVQIAAIVAAVNTQTSAFAIRYPAINTASITTTTSSIASQSSTGTYNPEPVAAATQTAVAQARGLVSQARTWGTQFAALQAPADAFGLDVNTASAVINSNSGALGGVFSGMIGDALKKVSLEAGGVNGLAATTYTFAIPYWTTAGLMNGSGTVTISDNAGNLRLAISATNSGITSNATITTNIPSTILGTSTPSLNLASLTMTVTGSSSMTTPSAASISFTNTDLSVVLKAGKTSATATEADIATINMNGGLTMQASGVTFTGTGRISAVANSVVGAKAPVSLAEIALTGAFTGSKGSANASALVKFNNAATFDTIGLLSYQPIVWDNQWLAGDTLGVAAAYAAATGGDILQQASFSSVSNQTCLLGTNVNTTWTCSTGDTAGVMAAMKVNVASRYNPAPLGMQNVYASYNYGMTSFNAMLTFADFETASYYANATVTVSSDVTLTGYPVATLSVTANRTAFGSSLDPIAGDVVATLAYNGQSVKIEAANATAPGTGTVTITNPDGVKLVLNGTGNTASGTVSVNSVQVGTIETGMTGALIRYSDNTFESLN